jgi:3D (Asp-Asp-Asp) domain-containing protein
MGKVKIVVLVTLISVFFAGNTHAGFYNWLKDSGTSQTKLLGANTLGVRNDWSFSKIYNQSISHESDIEDGAEPAVIEITEEITGSSVARFVTVRATGYSSTPDQTDSTPFITASGSTVRDGIIAANFHIDGRRVPFGTKIRIPDLFGDKVFVVEDRMNSRYTSNIDIWFPERGLAQRFGSHLVNIEIIHEETENS